MGRDNHLEVLAVWTSVCRRGCNSSFEETPVVEERPPFAHLVSVRR